MAMLVYRRVINVQGQFLRKLSSFLDRAFGSAALPRASVQLRRSLVDVRPKKTKLRARAQAGASSLAGHLGSHDDGCGGATGLVTRLQSSYKLDSLNLFERTKDHGNYVL